ncbi:MAG: hypothetical protein MJ177_08920, partial [Clostridia bacterium]|nr:hypothetical protein [Clostridia bacterium]
MHTVKKGVLRDMMQQLEKYCVFSSVDIPEWKLYEGIYLGHGKYELNREKIYDKKLTDRWSACYDCARFFSAEFALPELFRSHKLYLQLDFGGEVLVKLNGKFIGSLSSRENSGWVGRETINIPSDSLNFDSPNLIELEAAIDSGSFCDKAMNGAKSMEYQMKYAKISAVDEKCEKFYLDCDFIWEALDKIDDEFIRLKVYNALDDALHAVDYDFDEQQVRSSIYEASQLLDRQLADIKYTPQAQVIMAGHSHIDVAWLWRIQESERKAARTFSNTLSLMDAYPDFRFTQSQAVLYDMVKENYPEIYEGIKQKVKNGQWNITGNTWVECDTNIASGESMVRQLLYGREFFLKEFGVSSEIYWLPDCFGFSWSLPQIIKRSGMKYFITSKLRNQDTNRFPHTVFRWRGTDGSEIIAYNQRSHYQGEYDAAQVCATAYTNDQKAEVNTTFGMFGYGDGGGGCTYRMLERAKRLEAFPGLPTSKMGHPQEFFAEAEKSRDELPVYCDELYYENHRGTYTSQAFIKKNNRRGEFLLTRTEIAGVINKICAGNEFDRDKIEKLWKALLKNQFHDILPGTSIHEAIEDCRAEQTALLEEGREMFSDILGSIAKNIKTDGGILVWNLLPHAVTAPVKCGGNELIARDIPAMGYKVISENEANAVYPPVKAEKGLLENENLKVIFDEDGIIKSVYDKRNNREVLDGEGNLITVFIDKCIHETAWNLEQNYVKKQWELRKAESIEAFCDGLKGVVRIVRKFNKSTVKQDIILYTGSDRVDFVTEVDWQERDKMMKAAFDLNVSNTYATFESAYGAIKRPTHRNSPFDAARFEQCAHKWADLSEGDYGVSILNDCKYGYDVLGSKMRITMMRAPTCPDRKGDLGINTFTYSLYPHAGTWQSADTVKRALELNVPLEAYEAAANDGCLPDSLSLIST